MPDNAPKHVVVIGGPNGAGKTTASNRLLPPVIGSARYFLNADEIARELSPSDPDQAAVAAGRLLLERIDECMRSGASFAFETTCAGRSHIQRLRLCRTRGYQVALIFLWLPSPEAALARVAQRVANGGHSIPRDVIIRRYSAGLRNMREYYLPLADTALVYDNSEQGRVLIADKQLGAPLVVHDTARWTMIEEAIR
jgi:predicted ABC-type ATPase